MKVSNTVYKRYLYFLDWNVQDVKDFFISSNMETEAGLFEGKEGENFQDNVIGHIICRDWSIFFEMVGK